MSSQDTRIKRIYLVNRDFQLRYTRIAVLVGALSTCLTLFLILYPLFYLDIVRFPNFVPRPFLIGIACAALLNFAVIAALGILMTHRIAGPMFSLVRQMRAIQNGHWTSYLRIRASDDLKYVVRNFNELVDYLTLSSRQDQSRIRAALAALEGPAPDVAAAAAALRELDGDIVERVATTPGGGAPQQEGEKA